MYNIIQLNEKDLSELQQIAKELGLKKTSSLKKEELVYKILDEQAIKSASIKANSEKSNDGQTKKRTRISVKKEGDKVYTANKEKATKLEANTPVLKKREISKKSEELKTEEVISVINEEQPKPEIAEESKPKAKRGRKPGSKNKATIEKEQNKKKEEAKTENQTIEEEPKPIVLHDDDMELPPLDLTTGGDFIPIEDLPSESFEIPSELLGKF